jgi:glutaredoxin-dependent peroxiredoxin
MNLTGQSPQYNSIRNVFKANPKDVVIIGADITKTHFYFVSYEGTPLWLLSSATDHNLTRMINIGEKVPEFTLFDIERKRRSLNDFKGRKLVLAFFPGAFTSTCIKEMCRLRDDIAKLESLDSQVIGISVNDPFTLKAFHDDNLLNFPLLSDYTRDTVKAYNIELVDFAGMAGYTVAKRSVFILDKEGTLRWRWVTENPGIEPDYLVIRQQLEKV